MVARRQFEGRASAGVTLLEKMAFGHLTNIFPLESVRDALAEHNRKTVRVRELPTELTVYLQILQGLYGERPQKEVLACTTEGLQYLFGTKEFKLPSKAAISKRRSHVGWEPLKLLFDRCCKPLSKPGTKGSYYKNWLVTALDGTDFDLADTPENDKYFGRSQNQNSVGPYPKAHAVALMEVGTRTAIGLEIGVYRDSELTLAEKLIPTLSCRYLVLADRLFMSYDLFKEASDTGAALVFRARLDRKLDPVEYLNDGSFISMIYPSEGPNRKQRGIKVRAIEYEVVGSPSGEIIRLITSILDPRDAPADDLATLYHERWEIETMLDELKTHLEIKIVRSKTPNLVKQEIYGIFMAHYALKSVMHGAARRDDIDPDNVSFIHSVRVIRRAIISSGAFSP